MSRRLRKINDWAERAARARWCVTTLANDCGVSVSTLERHFRETMGMGPYDWLNAERMRRARELLQDDSSVKETAMELGFKTTQHFSLAFKKYHGYPPSGFLDLLRRQTPDARRQLAVFAGNDGIKYGMTGFGTSFCFRRRGCSWLHAHVTLLNRRCRSYGGVNAH